MTTELTPSAVLRRRLAVQRLVGRGLSSATEVVALLGCVQSQEQAHALWSLGLRTASLDAAAVRRELDEGRFVRTHILRPTWHFVAAADLRWILALTSPRVQQTNGTQYRKLGLTPSVLDRGAALLLDALAGGPHLTRPELAFALRAGGIDADGQRLAYVVMHAELEGLICSGPLLGAVPTYAVLDERLPPTPTAPGDRDAQLAELTWRFFAGHGPAEVKDLSRWSSLTVADVRAGLELVGDRLQCVRAAGLELWHDPAPFGELRPDEPEPRGPDGLPSALLLPLYDEAALSYPRLPFPTRPGHPHPPGADLFVGSVIVGTDNVGTWRRSVQVRRVAVEVALAPGLPAAEQAAVAVARKRLATFLGLELVAAGPGP